MCKVGNVLQASYPRFNANKDRYEVRPVLLTPSTRYYRGTIVCISGYDYHLLLLTTPKG